MSTKVRSTLFFIFAYLLALALYWPALHGTPIWDDLSFWFADPVMGDSMPYLTIWKNFAWPFSVSLQKLVLGFWHKNYFNYHVLNLALHFANAGLVYLLGKEIKLKYKYLYFLLFLLHPACVISTAWMVQVKTLLCFFFALSSLLAFIKGQSKTKWMICSWIFFLFSLASKSSSLTLPLLFLLLSYKKFGLKRLHYLIPFFLLSGLGAYRILTSPVTIEGSSNAKDIVEKVSSPIEKGPVILKDDPVLIEGVKSRVAHEIKIKSELPSQSENQNSPATLVFRNFSFNFPLILKTSYYYFWQILLPIHTAPIKGLNYAPLGFEEILNLIFILSFCYIFWNDVALIYLGTAVLLLLPFLGIVPAPFMSITWVSDQHLYLVLPALLAFWDRVLSRIPWKHVYLAPIIFLIFYSYKTYKTTPIYKDQFVFYRTSLQYNPYNIPVSYNLGFAYLMKGDLKNCYQTVSDSFYLSQNEPMMKESPYFSHLAEFYFKLRKAIEQHED